MYPFSVFGSGLPLTSLIADFSIYPTDDDRLWVLGTVIEKLIRSSFYFLGDLRFEDDKSLVKRLTRQLRQIAHFKFHKRRSGHVCVLRMCDRTELKE